MNRYGYLLGSVLIVLVVLPAHAQRLRRDTEPPLSCTKCHTKTIQWHDWLKSAHHKTGLTCTDCHQGANKQGHTKKTVRTKTCTDCHYWWKDKARMFKGSVHERAGLSCTSCHNPHRDTAMAPKGSWASRCTTCHKGDPLEWHAFFPKAKLHLEEHSCKVCHEDVHGIGKNDMATVSCSSCHPKGTGLKHVDVNAIHSFLPHTKRHLSTLRCEDCHRPKGPVRTCTKCHSSHPILERGSAQSAFTNPYTQKHYKYVIGATHLKWLDIIGLLLFAGGAAVWIFHGGLRLIARAMRRRAE